VERQNSNSTSNPNGVSLDDIENSNFLDLSQVDDQSNVNMDVNRLDNIPINNYQSANEGGAYNPIHRKKNSNSTLGSPTKAGSEAYSNQR
jgi:hypothetical protein